MSRPSPASTTCSTSNTRPDGLRPPRLRHLRRGYARQPMRIGSWIHGIARSGSAHRLRLRRLLAGAMTTIVLLRARTSTPPKARASPSASSRSICAWTSWSCGSPSRAILPRSLGSSRNPATRTWRSSPSRFPINHGLAEEIIPLNPDLVLAGIYTTRTAVGLLKRTDVPLHGLDVPTHLRRRCASNIAEYGGYPRRARARPSASSPSMDDASRQGSPREPPGRRARARSCSIPTASRSAAGYARRRDHDASRARKRRGHAEARRIWPDPAGNDRDAGCDRRPDRQREPRRAAGDGDRSPQHPVLSRLSDRHPDRGDAEPACGPAAGRVSSRRSSCSCAGPRRTSAASAARK